MDIKKAIDSAQRAQRNYDLSKTIPQEDLDTLIYAATNSPSKQNETHYSLEVFTDADTIQSIVDKTKLFSLMKDPSDKEGLFGLDDNGNFWQDKDRSVTNSQIHANSVFVFVRHEGETRGGTNMLGKENPNSKAGQLYNENLSYSMGIAVGELILTAGLLGYKTGICSAMDTRAIRDMLGLKQNPKLIVGVGYENVGTDRRLHSTVRNKDIAPKFRTGDDDEKWRFPSFEKTTAVKLNGNNY